MTWLDSGRRHTSRFGRKCAAAIRSMNGPRIRCERYRRGARNLGINEPKQAEARPTPRLVVFAGSKLNAECDRDELKVRRIGLVTKHYVVSRLEERAESSQWK